MIALDTNILVYARRAEAPHHSEARKILEDLAQGDRPWALPWPCVYEFLRVVTHPRVFDPPTTLDAAMEDLCSLLESPALTMLGEGPGHLAAMRQSVISAHATGNLVHDAHIAALLLENGIREFWTADRDFSRFSALKVLHPFR
ncbi:MAG: TA system VapC family ribonuclease toxin [Bryobacteraceae bacterium]